MADQQARERFDPLPYQKGQMLKGTSLPNHELVSKRHTPSKRIRAPRMEASGRFLNPKTA